MRVERDTAPPVSKGAECSGSYEIHDGVRVVARADRQSGAMRAAKSLPLGTTCGRAGESATFVLTERGWLFTG